MLEFLTGALVEAVATADDRREWAVNRPSRGAHSRIVQQAATFPQSMRACVAAIYKRESGATLDDRTSGMGARNPASSASGRGQWLDTSWRRPLSFHVRDRLIEFGMPKRDARQARAWLEATHISQWPGILQDVGMIETVERGGYGPWGGCPR